jgi:hypothetical protein
MNPKILSMAALLAGLVFSQAALAASSCPSKAPVVPAKCPPGMITTPNLADNPYIYQNPNVPCDLDLDDLPGLPSLSDLFGDINLGVDACKLVRDHVEGTINDAIGRVKQIIPQDYGKVEFDVNDVIMNNAPLYK